MVLRFRILLYKGDDGDNITKCQVFLGWGLCASYFICSSKAHWQKNLQCISILLKIKAKLHSRVYRTQRDLCLPSCVLCLPRISTAVLCASESWLCRFQTPPSIGLFPASFRSDSPPLTPYHPRLLLFRCWDKSHLTTESFFENCLKNIINLSQIILCAFLSKTQHIIS